MHDYDNTCAECGFPRLCSCFNEAADSRLRDEFAMAALTGLLSGRWNTDTVARVAYSCADSMMAERERSRS